MSQEDVLCVMKKTGRPMTAREISDALGINIRSVYQSIEVLSTNWHMIQISDRVMTKKGYKNLYVLVKENDDNG